MQELLGVEERQRTRARAEHDHEELLAAAPRGHGEVVACLLREARLERLHATRIAEERDVPRVDAAAVDECLAAEQRTRHRVVVDQSPGERGEIARVAPLDRIGQAVRVGEARAGQPEVARLVVHPCHEHRLVAAAEAFGERAGRVVRRGDGHALEQHVHRHLLARAQSHAVAPDGGGVTTHAHDLVHVDASGVEVLAGEVQRHQLDQTRGGALVVGVLRVDDTPVGVDEQQGLGAEVGGAGGVGGDGGGRDDERDHAEERCEHGAEHYGHSRAKTLERTLKTSVADLSGRSL